MRRNNEDGIVSCPPLPLTAEEEEEEEERLLTISADQFHNELGKSVIKVMNQDVTQSSA